MADRPRSAHHVGMEPSLPDNQPGDPSGPSPDQALRRSYDGRMLAGVAAGAARYFEVDVVVVRIALVALTLLGGIGVPLYLAAWLLVPDEDADESVAEHVLGGHRIEVSRRDRHPGPWERRGHGVSA